MKKLLAVFCLLGVLLSLPSCSSSGGESKSSGETDSDVTTTSSLIVLDDSEDDEPIIEGCLSKKDVIPLIFSTQWGEPKSQLEGGLFKEGIELPLDLLSIDDYCAPYRFKDYYKDKTVKDKFTDFLNLGDDVYVEKSSSLGLQIETQEGASKEDSGIGMIYIMNYSDNDKQSIKECIENGWWHTAGDPIAALRLDKITSTDSQYYLDLHKSIFNKLGTPTYIFCTDVDYFRDAEFEINSLEDYYKYQNYDNKKSLLGIKAWYIAIYEYEDFTLCVDYVESGYQLGNTNSYKKEDHVSVSYYTKECWEHKKADYSKNSFKLY